MKHDQWHEVERLFEAALELTATQQKAFLAAACNGDEGLRHEVESLLTAERAAAAHATLPLAVKLAATPPHKNGAPPHVNNYRLLAELGSGGMGAVWLAERADDQFQQRVAIKFVHTTSGKAEIMRRFRHERQILASLDHPNIARLLDGGTTAEGQPYFVMEYVAGQPIDEYCRAHDLSLHERLRLFRAVCSAVQYAHQHLVIHRDLKPSNILVTEDGTVKLLDFGIAKLMQPALSQSYETLTGATPMTPAYASPEQVRSEKLTTASDVYSLGVILYELLTEQSPYQLQNPSLNEVMRAVCEQEPERPSAAATTGGHGERETRGKKESFVTASPHPRVAASQLRGDLDAITLKALRKESAARYGSVEQLSDDLQHYLEGLPVTARKGTLSYRATRFLRRHKVPVAAAALLLLSLFGGIGATSHQARIARIEKATAIAERNRAESERVRAEAERRRAEQALAEVEAQRTRAENAFTTAEQRRQQAETARAEAQQQRLAAEAERNVAQTQRQRAEAQELAKRRLLYASQMKLAQAAWDESNVERVRELLTAHQPTPGQEDLRGFEWNWLWRLSHAEVTTLTKHAMVPIARFSADGKSLITSYYSAEEKVNVVRVWDSATWREKGSFRIAGNPGTMRSVISPDGSIIAMLLVSSCEVELWDVASTQVRWRLRVSGTCRRSLSFSPDGKRLLVRDPEQITLFDTQSGQELIRFNVQRLPENFYKGAFNPDGKTYATVGPDFQIHVYDLLTGKEVQTIARPGANIGVIAYSPTGRYMILGTSTTKISFTEMVIQDTQTQQEVHRLEAEGIPVFSPNERFLVVPKDRDIRILDTEKWQERASFKVQNVSAIAFAPTSERFVTAGLDAMKIWDLNVSPAATSYAIDNAFAQTITFSPDSQKMYVQAYSPPQANNFSITKGWELTTQREVNSFLNSGSATSSQSLSPDGSKLAYSGRQEILIKDTNTNAELWRLKTNSNDNHRDLSWSSDGRKLVAVIGLTIWIWDVQTGQVLQVIRPTAVMLERFRQAVLLRDQTTLLLLGEAKLCFYDLTTRRFLRTVPIRDGYTMSMTLSADETKIAIGLANGEVQLYDAINGQELVTLKGHSSYINQLSFSPDNRRLATSSQDSTVRVWDLLTGQEMLLFRDTGSSGGVAFSPDGEHLAVAYQRGVVKVYSTAPQSTPFAARQR